MQFIGRRGCSPSNIGFYSHIALPPAFWHHLAMDPNEVKQVDPHFYDRADAHINLSNEQIQEQTPGKVSSSMMYATARFNAWWVAYGFASGTEFAATKQEQIEYYGAAAWVWGCNPECS